MIPNLSWGNDFAGLASYLIEHRDHQLVSLRGVSSIEAAPREMEEVALASARVRSPALHVSFSAATEDGILSDDSWLELVNEVDGELGLPLHQRVVVRHRDKDYDHIHVFWCTVNPQTGQTPSKQIFRTRGAPMPELDQRALSPKIVARLPASAVTRGAFNRFALARLMSVCRQFEREKNLRRLRDRKSAAAARAAGELRPLRQADRHREERTGRLPVTEAGDVIRKALDQPDYTFMRRALNQAGFDFEPVTRTRKDGSVEFRGLIVCDMIDPDNRAPASAFDTAELRYGLRQIEKRHALGAATIEAWWPIRDDRSGVEEMPHVSFDGDIYQAFQTLRDQHRRDEAQRKEQRVRIAKRQAADRLVLRTKLMRLRQLRAKRLPPGERRAFYSRFARTTREIIWSRMERRHAGERVALRRRVMISWKQFQKDRLSRRPIDTKSTIVAASTAASSHTLPQVRPALDPNGPQSPGPDHDTNTNARMHDGLAEFYRARRQRGGR